LLRSSQTKSGLKLLYRYVLDSLEAFTMTSADLIVVNSQFTKTTVQATFSSLAHQEMPILYPALDTSTTQKSSSSLQQVKTNQSPIVSLNRFERKKNISLVIYAYQYLKQTYPDQELPPLIVAGGYDTKNVENVEYRGELQTIVDTTQLQDVVTFKCDISDVERAQLFQTALGVVYTPDKEHFGIVPLEAMYAGTPVLAVNSGGPMETVVDGVTGFLRLPTPQEFGEALLLWIKDPSKATKMGQMGKKHVEAKFGTKRLEQEFQALLEKALEEKEKTTLHLTLWSKVGVYPRWVCIFWMLSMLFSPLPF
jgi:alpha-1,3/alpha-1,6-mannosyltransferase